MDTAFTQTARRFGIASAIILATLLVAYAITLAVGFMSLESPDQPIGDPMFTILEVLILTMMPAMVALMVAVHTWTPVCFKVFSLTAVAFMSMLAVVTSALHFLILTLSRQPEFATLSSLPLLVAFKWPSVAYALDILAWDVFFALAMLFAAPVFSGSGIARSVRYSMITSGVLALAGLSGVVTGDMQLRNIGIVGYLGVFLIVVVLLAVLFHRTAPTPSERAE
ncbi:hypothetical protein KQI65_08700 [bacterium]|nr:hypothetical protein [bacterium]